MQTGAHYYLATSADGHWAMLRRARLCLRLAGFGLGQLTLLMRMRLGVSLDEERLFFIQVSEARLQSDYNLG